jgi:hypothetical protein
VSGDPALAIGSDVLFKFLVGFGEGYVLMVANVPINVWILSTTFVIGYLTQHLEHF